MEMQHAAPMGLSFGLQTLWEYRMRRPAYLSWTPSHSLRNYIGEGVPIPPPRAPPPAVRNAHAAPFGFTCCGHRHILSGIPLARGCQSHPLALPLHPFEASTALHVHTRECVRDSRARWRSAVPVLFLPSPRIVARRCESHPLALPLQPFEMRVDANCVASAGPAPLLAPAAAQRRSSNSATALEPSAHC